MLYRAKVKMVGMLGKTKVRKNLASVVRGLDAGNGYREMVAVGAMEGASRRSSSLAVGVEMRRGGVGTIT